MAERRWYGRRLLATADGVRQIAFDGAVTPSFVQPLSVWTWSLLLVAARLRGWSPNAQPWAADLVLAHRAAL
ncbi:hypothetical protein [Plantactinospora sp. WMMB782]|uniref:hypothetical protein n=1 Tax=Plantactinospora sp. WMMB782 TaxID=3404121 RepID=UPI003B93EAFF